jgi:hypothetical protein
MQSVIKDTEWYKNITKDFIDTNPPKPVTPAKKMPFLQDLLIRTNKMIDIGFITTIYFILGAIVANIITKYQTEFNNKNEDKRTVIKSTLSLILLIWINGVLIYFARNIVELIPYPFDDLFGFHHKKVKELGAATAFTFVLLYYQPNLNKMMKYLSVRWNNTFEGQTFIGGIKLLTKPAIKPTITDEDDKNKNNKNNNINNNRNNMNNINNNRNNMNNMNNNRNNSIMKNNIMDNND